MKKVRSFNEFVNENVNEGRKIRFENESQIMNNAAPHSQESIHSVEFGDKLENTNLNSQLDFIKFLGSTMSKQQRTLFIKRIWSYFDEDTRSHVLKKSGMI